MTCSRTGRRPPRTVELTIGSLAFGGDAVGRDDDGRVTFVADAAPGDRVRVTLVEEHKGWARGTLARVLERGPARVDPPCPLALPDGARPACGGCPWQHVAATAQDAAKLDIVQRALRKVTQAVEPLRTPCSPLGWRRRTRLRARRGVLGFAARRSHALVDVATCPQLTPALDAALGVVRAALTGVLGEGASVSLLAGARGDVHVAIEARDVAALVTPAERLLGQAGIRGVALLGDGGRELGEGAIDLADDDLPFWGRADGFAQASHAGNAALRALVRECLGDLGGQRVLELHAGSGNFTRDLVRAGARVTSVEEVAPATALAERSLAPLAAAGHDLPRVIAETAGAALDNLAGEAWDAVLLDPPRAGLGPDEARRLAALGAPVIVYVSCDPETLARDLGVLVAAGYAVERAVPVDLMPQTSHVEVTVRLTRSGLG